MDVKKPATYSQQVDAIKRKGFVVNDTESCISFLRQANYYRLSAYFLPFKTSGGEYLPGFDFTTIQNIYEFDSHLRAMLFQIIEEVELYLRTQLSYFVAHQYGALGYLNQEIYSPRHNSERFTARIQKCIEENTQTPVVRHHQNKYGGKFPIWVLIEFFSVGMLSYFYSDLNSEAQKKIARGIFFTSVSCMKSWLRCLTELRNRCAHYARLYYWSFASTPKMPMECDFTAERKLFTQILMLKYLYPDSAKWEAEVVPAFEQLLADYAGDISLEHIGFPENWNTLLKKT